jgi:hypothetical protein
MGTPVCLSVDLFGYTSSLLDLQNRPRCIIARISSHTSAWPTGQPPVDDKLHRNHTGPRLTLFVLETLTVVPRNRNTPFLPLTMLYSDLLCAVRDPASTCFDNVDREALTLPRMVRSNPLACPCREVVRLREVVDVNTLTRS